MSAAPIGQAARGGRARQSKEGRSFKMREDGSGSAYGAEVVATVKWFNPVKGFGFLTPADVSRDLFCHVSAVWSRRPIPSSLPTASTRRRISSGPRWRVREPSRLCHPGTG